MPSSGELRLRTLILALIALGGIWIALVIQRAHPVPAAAFASGPRPADLGSPKLVRVPGLNRPVAATPIANVSPRVRPFTWLEWLPTLTRASRCSRPRRARPDRRQAGHGLASAGERPGRSFGGRPASVLRDAGG